MFLKKSQTHSENLLSGNLGTRQELWEFPQKSENESGHNFTSRRLRHSRRFRRTAIARADTRASDPHQTRLQIVLLGAQIFLLSPAHLVFLQCLPCPQFSTLSLSFLVLFVGICVPMRGPSRSPACFFQLAFFQHLACVTFGTASMGLRESWANT